MKHDKEFFNKAFTDSTNNEPYNVPDDIRKVAERICMAYGIRGICDPMYIANLIAIELGLGDGSSNFESPIDKTEVVDDLISEVIYSQRMRSGGEVAEKRQAVINRIN